MTGNIALLATALMAPLELPITEPHVLDDFPTERIYEGWFDLARRIVATPR